MYKWFVCRLVYSADVTYYCPSDPRTLLSERTDSLQLVARAPWRETSGSEGEAGMNSNAGVCTIDDLCGDVAFGGSSSANVTELFRRVAWLSSASFSDVGDEGPRLPKGAANSVLPAFADELADDGLVCE